MEANETSEVLTISRKDMVFLFINFPDIKIYMLDLAKEKLFYYRQLLDMLITLYCTKEKQADLCAQRMKTPVFTTYLSLKE